MAPTSNSVAGPFAAVDLGAVASLEFEPLIQEMS